MAVRTLTEYLDNLYTSTWQNMRSTVTDNIFTATPFWYLLKEQGHLKKVEGGRFITEPLEYAKNEDVSWISKGGTVSLNDYERLTISKWDWRYLVAPIVRFGVDDQQNRGKNQIFDLVRSKMNNTQESLIDTLETRLFAASGSGASESGDAFDGLQLLVKDDPTTSTSVGDINQSTYDWWQNQTKNMTGISFATSGVSWMRNMYNNVMNNKRRDAPTLIISGQTPYEYYEDEGLEYYRTMNNKLLDMGFQNQQFKGAPWVWSPACADTRLYMLNLKFMYFAYDPMMFFDATEWKPIPDQVNDRAMQIITACSLVTNRRKSQGVMYNIDTA